MGKLKSGCVKVGDEVKLEIDVARRLPIMNNHTSTHILNFALRKVLGSKVDQKGSLVDAEKLRFDFSHNKPMTTAEMQRVEEICSDVIAKNLGIYSKLVTLSDAYKINGLRAVFGETYPDPVKVVCVGKTSECSHIPSRVTHSDVMLQLKSCWRNQRMRSG